MSADAWAAIAAAVAALVAAGQVAIARDEANKRAVLDHVRDIEAHLEKLRHLHGNKLEAVQDEVVSCYRTGNRLSDDARRYIALLSALEFSALAVRMAVVDAPLLGEYLEAMVKQGIVKRSVIIDLQACHDPSTYKDLLEFMQARNLR